MNRPPSPPAQWSPPHLVSRSHIDPYFLAFRSSVTPELFSTPPAKGFPGLPRHLPASRLPHTIMQYLRGSSLVRSSCPSASVKMRNQFIGKESLCRPPFSFMSPGENKLLRKLFLDTSTKIIIPFVTPCFTHPLCP